MTHLEADIASHSTSRLGEGRVWDVKSDELVWIDILGKEICRTDPVTGDTIKAPTPAAPGAVSFDAQGRLLASLPDGLYDTVRWTAIAPIESENPNTRCNDGRVDPWGRLVQGTMGWDGEPGLGSVYRVTSGGEVETLMSALTVPNGIAWSADAHTLYHVDSATRAIRKFPYSEFGKLGEGKVAFAVESTVGVPDGMTIDTEGCLWVALWGAGSVHRYTPDGRLDAVVELPVTHVTSCCFGGKAMDILFITTARGSVAFDREPHAGKVFVCRPGTSGFPENHFGES